MALTFDVTQIADYTEKYPNVEEDVRGRTMYRWHPTTESIVWGCIATDIGHIKDAAEADAWFDRYERWNEAAGFDTNLTREDVHGHIGLRTNVFPRTSDRAFAAKLRKVTAETERRAAARA